MERHSPMGTAGNLVLIACFLACTLIPGIASLAGWDPSKPIDERRTLNEKPTWSWTLTAIDAYPKGFESYYQDHFGLRNTIIRWHNYVYVAAFGVSPTPRVILGKDNWAFVGWDEARGYMQRKEPSDTDWDTHWAQLLKERNDWLAKRNIRFVFGIVPESYTMYPEMLPEQFDLSAIPSLQDRILAATKDIPGLTVIDFRPALNAAKAADRALLYQKLDGHWQDNGAFIAYTELMNRVAETNPAWAPRPISDFTVTKGLESGGALNRMLSLPVDLKEELVVITPKLDLGPFELNYKKDPLRWTLGKNNPQGPEGRALMFTDSYGEFLMPYISQDFRYSHYVALWHQKFSPELFEDFVTRAEPDVVIWLFAERWLMWIEPAKLMGLQ